MLPRVRSPFLAYIPWVLAGSVLFGFFVTFPGMHGWDDHFRYAHSLQLLADFGLRQGSVSGTFYAPLWELFLGIATEFIFPFLRDPLWVRHALLASLLPLGLFFLFHVLRRAGVQRSTAFLALAMMLGIIRFTGQGLVNLKDYPAAWTYLLSALALWVILRETFGTERSTTGVIVRLVLAGIVAVLPFLVRSPLLSLLALLTAFLAAGAVLGTWIRRPLAVRLLFPFIPLLSAGFVILLLYPPAWLFGVNEAVTRSFETFQFYKFGPRVVRFFGLTAKSGHLPWWYAFVWLPVMSHPLAFLTGIVGLALSIPNRAQIGHPFPVRTFLGTFNFSLIRYLWIFVLLSWSAVIAIRPLLYSEDRQILFLYPPVFLLAALGLDGLRERLKWILSIVLIAASLWTYVAWGRYSYTYISPLVGQWKIREFTGDYWGVCIAQAMNAMIGRIPHGTQVKIDGPFHIARLQEDRYRSSVLFQNLLFDYRLRGNWPEARPYAAIAFNAPLEKGIGRVERDIAEGRATLVWNATVPTGENVCILAYYPENE